MVVTPGSSGALQLVCAAVLSPGDEVLLADPGYPCNRHFVRLFEGVPVAIPVGPSTSYQLTGELVRRHWTPRTVAVIVGSPSNPTGTVICDDEMERIAHAVEELGGILIVDEIYHGLVYDGTVSSAIGRPLSPPSTMRGSIGTSPRKSTPSSSAVRWPPPRPKMW